MKPTQLSTLFLALAACLSAGMAHAEDDKNQAKKLNYPHTPIHQEQLDPFLYGEFGISANTASTRNAVHSSNPHAPDDGIDHYAAATHVDKYRWLEDYDNIDARIAKESSKDRERNLIGTIQEDDKPLTQAVVEYLQTVPTPTSSRVNDWVNAQNAVTESYIQQLPVYEQLKKNVDALKMSNTPLRESIAKTLVRFDHIATAMVIFALSELLLMVHGPSLSMRQTSLLMARKHLMAKQPFVAVSKPAKTVLTFLFCKTRQC